MLFGCRDNYHIIMVIYSLNIKYTPFEKINKKGRSIVLVTNSIRVKCSSVFGDILR